MNNFSIYIHVPWCRRRCPYCNFYFKVGRPDSSFVDGIIAEWQERRHEFGDKAVTVYFGGGTPSLLFPRELTRLIAHFSENCLSTDAEITLEANPEDLTESYVEALRDSPINRISLGVQSFDNNILRVLGRKHTGAMAKDAIDRLQKVGLSNISVDQIIGVPGEKSEQIKAAQNYLHDVDVKHISSYLLTIEEGTLFHRQKISPSDDQQADAYVMVQEELTRLGYMQYDISSYAKPSFLSQHNQAYWGAKDYIGLGPGAHSMRKLKNGGIERSHNRAELSLWLKEPSRPAHFSKEVLDRHHALREALAFGLRNMAKGINPEFYAALYEAPIPPGFLTVMNKFKDLGWLECRKENYLITAAGALFADCIMREILCCDYFGD